MNYPELPQTFDGMTAAELRELSSQIRAARRAEAAANPTMSADEDAAWRNWGTVASRIDTLADEAEVAEAAEAQREADEQAAAAAREAEEAAAAEAEAAAAAESDDDEETDDDTDETEASIQVRDVQTDLALDGNRTPEVTRSGWLSTGRGGFDAGHEFADSRELGAAVQEVMASVADGDNDKRVIARLPAQVNDAQRIHDEQLFVDLARLSDPNEIEAAFCTPLTPLYALACANVTRRPVFNGLPTFVPDANRGGFRVPTSPSLDDITGGFGQWTSANDADAEAIKNACQTISCVTWNDFEWYGTYRCLTVRNMMQMTFPELVDAYLNRLQARWARYAEVLLLEAMGNQSTSIDGFAQSYGANVSLQRVLLTYLGKYQEIERWDTPEMDAWMPRWLLWALRMDIASRRKDAGGMVPSVEEVERGFREIGVEPHWYMDRPSWATPISPLAVSGDLTMFPSTVEILVHRRGKFAVMDKGELTVGLGGNPIRIEDDLRRNQATFFFESFEGLIDTDSCPAHLITVPGLCYNGSQIADVNIECEGYDLTPGS